MRRLLEVGEEKQVGDKIYSRRLGEWITIREETLREIDRIVDEDDMPISREIEEEISERLNYPKKPFV